MDGNFALQCRNHRGFFPVEGKTGSHNGAKKKKTNENKKSLVGLAQAFSRETPHIFFF